MAEDTGAVGGPVNGESAGAATGPSAGSSTGIVAGAAAAEAEAEAVAVADEPAGYSIRSATRESPGGPTGDAGIRLQKVLAAAGIGSRRACEALIATGRVEVDGRRVREQGLRIDPATAVVKVDGERIATAPGLVHLAFNKPIGMVSAMSDPEGRPNLGDVVGDRSVRLFHVGRLDVDTEGLLLLTNEGELAHRLAHPSYQVSKTYLAEITGPVPRSLGRQLRAGVDLEDGPVQVDSFRLVESLGNRVMVEVVLHEGRQHVVRRLLGEVGFPVRRLVRVAVGPVRLGDLRAGRTRRLTRPELAGLYAVVGLG